MIFTNYNVSKCITKFGNNGKKQSYYSLFCITGPSLPYGLDLSAMAESPDDRGVLLFGGLSNGYEKRILELRAGADSWNIYNVSLVNGRRDHVVIPLT